MDGISRFLLPLILVLTNIPCESFSSRRWSLVLDDTRSFCSIWNLHSALKPESQPPVQLINPFQQLKLPGEERTDMAFFYLKEELKLDDMVMMKIIRKHNWILYLKVLSMILSYEFPAH